MKTIARIFVIASLVFIYTNAATAIGSSVQVVGKPIDSTSVVYAIAIPQPSQVDSIVVEVIYGAGSPQACNFIYGNGQYAPAPTALSNTAMSGNGLPPKGVFRYKFNKDLSAPAQIFAQLQNAVNGASFIAYIYRPTGGLPAHTKVYAHHADVFYGRQSTVTRTAPSPYCMGDHKTITVIIPLVNKHPNRPINITLQTGTQSITQQFFTPAQPGLHIAQVVLPSVYCFDTQLQIKVQSPTPSGGTTGDEIITGSMVIDVQQTENTLPVSLIHFEAEATKKTVALHWQTASEQNSSHFEIEKMTDNKSQIIAKITAQGNSNTTINYNYTDTEPTQGESYYRLIQTDLDGKKHPYNWTKTTYNAHQTLHATIYPNPATTQALHLSLRTNDDSNVTIAIYNTQGQMIHTQQLTTQSTQTIVSLSNILNPGIYIAKIQANDDTITQKFAITQ